MSSPRSAISSISFCDCETTTAMSVASHEARSRCSSRSRSSRRRSRGQPRLQLARARLPVRLHLVVHPHGGGLVDGDDHRLAGEAAAEEVVDDVLGDRVQPVVAGDQVVLLAELPLQLPLLVLVEIGLLDDRPSGPRRSSSLVELQLGDAVLVVERDRGAVRRSTRRSCRCET